MTPRRLTPDDPALPAALTLMQKCFTYMDGRIDPPSSIHRLDLASLRDTARTAEVWTLRHACVILTPQPTTLYLGKLATDPAHRGHGHARTLINHAKTRAQALDLPTITLETRIELVENHATFAALGFVETGRTAHPGYDSPTALTFTLTL